MVPGVRQDQASNCHMFSMSDLFQLNIGTYEILIKSFIASLQRVLVSSSRRGGFEKRLGDAIRRGKEVTHLALTDVDHEVDWR